MSEQKDPEAQRQTAPEGVSRRNLFHILGAAPALAAATGAALGQTHDHAAAPAAAHPAAKGPYQRKIFDDLQWHTVSVLSDLIIPADERSGSATQAAVPEFIDDWLDFRNREDGNRNFSAQILGGLVWLDRESMRASGKSFTDAKLEQQKALLDRIAWPARATAEDHSGMLFFTKFRDLVVSGFFSSKMGVADLPYLGNRPVAEWKGCEPKVWAVIEERMKNGYKGLGGEAKPWSA